MKMMDENDKQAKQELSGKEYWRSLEQLADTPKFREFLYREFPAGTTELASNSWTRRSFLTTMGASLALAGLAGCRRPVEKIVPYVTRPEQVNPGVPNTYATSMPFAGNAIGLLVTSREGRPIKIEGNPEHPSSLGAVNPWVQASILDLYDPDRSKAVTNDGAESTVDKFAEFWATESEVLAKDGGKTMAVLCEPFASPTLARLKEAFLRKYPNAHWGVWDAINDENIIAGVEMATGKALQPVYKFDEAQVICALDADFLGDETNSIANARGYAEARRVMSRDDEMCRLYVAESALSITGAAADHRRRVSSGRISLLAAVLAAELKKQGLPLQETGDWAGAVSGDDIDAKWISALASDLVAARGRSIVLAGRRQPPEIHALVLAINTALGNIGTTVDYYDVPDTSRVDSAKLEKVVGQVIWDNIRTLIVIGGNPAYNMPTELEGMSVLKKAKHVIQLSTYQDESSVEATWHIPQAHYLESWGDCRSVDGTLSVVQPLIQPLHGGKSDVEVLDFLATGEWRPGYDIVRETWQHQLPPLTFEKQWSHVLHDGLKKDSAVTPSRVSFDAATFTQALKSKKRPTPASKQPTTEDIEIGFYPSSIWDGRYANNGWLQEMPDAMTKLAWDNAALIAPSTAKALGVENGDVVELKVKTYTLEIPVWISPGQAANTLALPLGYGRTAAGRIGNGVGVNTHKIRLFKTQHFVDGVKVAKTGRKYELASTQDHGSMEGRPIVRENTLAGYKDKAEFFPKEVKHPSLVPLWDEHTYTEGYQWGMSIDLNTCIGCNACVVACQSENNIPIVGKEQVGMGREMHWMRLDRYYAGDTDDPEVMVQPMNCQHCENAPCEQVCPVAATMHDDEGLNVMVYNRCIGTRYCSNNCPFKVRRFNFFNYTNNFTEEHKMVQNPEVTVRFRGVMEKCTYCLHRINVTKHKARVEGRTVADGELVTACQQACPTRAITFGNINDPDSRVAKLKTNDRDYQVLKEYNLKTRTSYLAKLRNPHPDLAKTKPENGHDPDHNGHGEDERQG